MMTIRIKLFSVLLVAGLAACESLDTEHEAFLHDGEKVYPGMPINVFYRPGNQRLALSWQPSPDPSIVRYTIFWNNYSDSLQVDAETQDPADTMTVVIPWLQEYVYNFVLHAYDAKGNKSIPLEVKNARAYGPVYQASLFNRRPDGEPYTLDVNSGVPTLYFVQGDTIHIETVIEYTNMSGESIEKSLTGENPSMVLEDFPLGNPIRYRSSYIPAAGAIDTFYVTHYDTFPAVIPYEPLDKALFAAVSLQNDVGTLDESPLSKLWDGSTGPQGYPNIFHSRGDKSLPHHFTFDLGQVYEGLKRVEETGRNCCHNPDHFEIWGIDDLAGAETTKAGNDPGWKDEALAKGWTLLQEVRRSDDGQAPLTFNLLRGLPPVRYIRIRVLRTANSGYPDYNTSNTNMSELTFWRK